MSTGWTVEIEIQGDDSGPYYVDRNRRVVRYPYDCCPLTFMQAVNAAFNVQREGLRREQFVIARAYQMQTRKE